MNWDSVISFLKDQGPALVLLIIGYMNGRAIRAENKVRNDEFKAALEENHKKIEALFSGLSDADIVQSVSGPGDPAQPIPNEKPGG